MTSKLPQKLGIVGLIFGLVLMSVSWYVDRYNPFHLLSVAQVRSMTTSYSPPQAYTYLEDTILLLLPALWLQVFTIHAGALVNYSIWFFAVLLDGAIMYGLGVIIFTVRVKRRSYR